MRLRMNVNVMYVVGSQLMQAKWPIAKLINVSHRQVVIGDW